MGLRCLVSKMHMTAIFTIAGFPLEFPDGSSGRATRILASGHAHAQHRLLPPLSQVFFGESLTIATEPSLPPVPDVDLYFEPVLAKVVDCSRLQSVAAPKASQAPALCFPCLYISIYVVCMFVCMSVCMCVSMCCACVWYSRCLACSSPSGKPASHSNRLLKMCTLRCLAVHASSIFGNPG